jgi:hypothetical protein
MKQFDSIEASILKQKQNQEKALHDGENERKILSDKMTIIDHELDSALGENLKLKSLAYETETRVATY